MKRIVKLFPDTGHHYYFVPLVFDEGMDASRDAFREAYGLILPELQGGGHDVLRALVKCPEQWVQAPLKGGGQWLRYKFGKREYLPKGGFDGAPLRGIWLAIETNTGTRERGYVWEANDRPNPHDPDFIAWQAAGKDEKPTPYAAEQATDLFECNRPPTILSLSELCGLRENFGLVEPVELEIVWLGYRGEPIPVDIIVDFGNSRTIVLGLQVAGKLANSDELSKVCRPIVFTDSIDDASLSDFHDPNIGIKVPSSAFILKDPPFNTGSFRADAQVQSVYHTERRRWEETSKRYGIIKTTTIHETTILTRVERKIPQMYSEFSPTVIGDEATKILLSANVDELGTSFLSSPKRYTWDTDLVGRDGELVWLTQPNAQPLQCDLLRFMPPEALSRHYGRPERVVPPCDWAPGVRPVGDPPVARNSRSDSLVWVALAIIERAARQIVSEAWRENNQHLLRRYLRGVVVTFPPGWTSEERDTYFRAWRYAINVFYWTRYRYWDDPPPRAPDLIMSLDEAVASQLPIMFADIRHLGNRGARWINLFGRQRTQTGGERKTVRLLSIDIGGGTTDTAIVEYRARDGVGDQGAHLVSNILLTDSSSYAGDKVVSDIIQKVLLPKLGEPFAGKQSDRDEFLRILNRRVEARGQRVSQSILIRTVFVPMALRWLEDLKAGTRGTVKDGRSIPWTPLDCAAGHADEATIVQKIMELNRQFERDPRLANYLLPPDEPFKVDYDKVSTVVRDWSRSIAQTHARYIAAFDCDLVVVTGKPSELREVHEVFREMLPIELHRLVFAKGYHAGEWFPLSHDGNITDAKMVTATGAALFQAMASGFIDNWSLDKDSQRRLPPIRNYWGLFAHAQHGTGQRFQPGDVFLSPDKDEAEFEISVGRAIGRVRFLQLAAEPIYRLRWRSALHGGGQPHAIAPIRVRLRRNTKGADGRERDNEALELVDVKGSIRVNTPYGVDQRSVTLADVELKLQTLFNDMHWLDAGRFEVEWNAEI